MKNVRKLTLALAAIGLLSVGYIGAAAPAHASVTTGPTQEQARGCNPGEKYAVIAGIGVCIRPAPGG
jgi:hypothetical protein